QVVKQAMSNLPRERVALGHRALVGDCKPQPTGIARPAMWQASGMASPCVISVAITGSLPQKAHNPAVPITPEEQVESAHEAFEAGAALVHVHVRDDQGAPSSDPARFARVQEGVRRHCPGMILQFSTGGRGRELAERGAMLHLQPDMASLATGSVNFPTQ